MKEINVGTIIARKRREMGVTQTDLAHYIGVSKASVSKWETNASYPDITLLPVLSTYFGISIDDLMGYTPQLSTERIRAEYNRLAAAFATEKFDTVYAECHELIGQYFACYPLLLQMAVLLLNHSSLAGPPGHQQEIIEEALSLCTRIIKQSHDHRTVRAAHNLTLTCYLFLNRPQEILDLVGEEQYSFGNEPDIVAQAYAQLENFDQAQEDMQVAMYQHLLFLLSELTFNLQLAAQTGAPAEELIARGQGLIALFDVDKLHPNTAIQFYFAVALATLKSGDQTAAIDALTRYAKVCGDYLFPLRLQGDDFFNRLDNWFDNYEIGLAPPRSEALVKQSVMAVFTQVPEIAALADEARVKAIRSELQTKLGCV